MVEAANDASVPVHELGTATKAPVFNLSISGKTIFQTETSKLRSIWDEAIPAYMSRISTSTANLPMSDKLTHECGIALVRLLNRKEFL